MLSKVPVPDHATPALKAQVKKVLKGAEEEIQVKKIEQKVLPIIFAGIKKAVKKKAYQGKKKKVKKVLKEAAKYIHGKAIGKSCLLVIQKGINKAIKKVPPQVREKVRKAVKESLKQVKASEVKECAVEDL